MNSKQENKYSMGLSLRDFLNQNATVTSSLPGFGNLFSTFSDNMDKIRVIRELQESDKKGITQSKEQLKKDLVSNVLDMSRKILAFAKMTENAPLITEAYYPEIEL